MTETKQYRIYKITSLNTPLFFIGSSNNPKRYLSQLLHNCIKQYSEHILHNKKYSTCYYVIHKNDVSIEPVESFDSLSDLKYAMDDIIANNSECINRQYEKEIEDKIYQEIRSILTKNKNTKEQKKEYFKDYYIKNRDTTIFIKPEKQKIYYENNKERVSIMNKAKYAKVKQAKLAMLEKNTIE